MFESCVKKYSDKSAIVFEDTVLTYLQFNSAINKVANRLRELGVKRNEFVGIISVRSIEMIIGIYGIIKAGAAYVPIDPYYPEQRKQFILNDCNPTLILVHDSYVDTDITQFEISELLAEEKNTANPNIINESNDLIYCIYTSGTTGNPKGVLIEHHNLLNLNNYFVKELEIGVNDVVSQFFNIVFDGSIWEMTMALLSGAELIIASDEQRQNVELFENLLEKRKVTVAALPPMFYANMKKNHLRLTITAGSEAIQSGVRQAVSLGGRYLNSYGPTENTVAATGWLCSEYNENNSRIPIGRPISNVRVYIMQGEVHCGLNVPGELCITGESVARGYLNRDKLNAEKFVKDTFSDGRMYRTGDLARWRSDGNIEFLGRIDKQVKVRGFRIELGEVENKLRQNQNVNECAVIVRKDQSGDNALYAYFTSNKLNMDIEEIRTYLNDILPEYMVPSYYMQIESIPVNRSGKIDINRLPEFICESEKEFELPHTELEKAVYEAFIDILKRPKISINDEFISLGGDSIKAIRIVSKLRDLGISSNVKDIMRGSTPKRIALGLEKLKEKTQYNQEENNGTIINTPIINMFEKWSFDKPEHFNQVMVFNVDDIENCNIKKILTAIVRHHDILRAIKKDKSLEILSTEKSRSFDFYEYDLCGVFDAENEFEKKCNELQTSMNLSQGPLVKAAVFKLSTGKVMVLCIHHYVIDGVSWRIILDDFEVGVKQFKEKQEIKLADKTASYIQWAQLLNEYKDSKEFALEREYWNRKIEDVVKYQFEFIDDNNVYNHMENITFSLSKDLTDDLLFKSNQTFNTEINDILLSALVRAFANQFHIQRITVDIEGHGREKLHRNIDIDRTVGWFTDVYPVVLENKSDVEDLIVANKEMLHSVINKGIGYGLMDFCNTDSKISFNYLGSFDKENFGNNKYRTGSTIAPENQLPNDISFDSMVEDGVLKCHIIYNFRKYSTKTILDLSESYQKVLCEIIEYCVNSTDQIRTSSDYNSNLSTSDFNAILAELSI